MLGAGYGGFRVGREAEINVEVAKAQGQRGRQHWDSQEAIKELDEQLEEDEEDENEDDDDEKEKKK